MALTVATCGWTTRRQPHHHAGRGRRAGTSAARLRLPPAGDGADDGGVYGETRSVPQRQAVGHNLNATCARDGHTDIHIRQAHVVAHPPSRFPAHTGNHALKRHEGPGHRKWRTPSGGPPRHPNGRGSCRRAAPAAETGKLHASCVLSSSARFEPNFKHMPKTASSSCSIASSLADALAHLLLLVHCKKLSSNVS